MHNNVKDCGKVPTSDTMKSHAMFLSLDVCAILTVLNTYRLQSKTVCTMVKMISALIKTQASSTTFTSNAGSWSFGFEFSKNIFFIRLDTYPLFASNVYNDFISMEPAILSNKWISVDVLRRDTIELRLYQVFPLSRSVHSAPETDQFFYASGKLCV
jgi:hypothetical protein